MAIDTTELEEILSSRVTDIFVLNCVLLNNYVYFVPFVETEREIFLKTIIPSRKATKKYLEANNEI